MNSRYTVATFVLVDNVKKIRNQGGWKIVKRVVQDMMLHLFPVFKR